MVAGARAVFERAVADPDPVVFVRGAAHRRNFESAFTPPGGRAADPAAVVSPAAFQPRAGSDEILALTRHSPDKAPIPELAVELTKEGLDRGRIAG